MEPRDYLEATPSPMTRQERARHDGTGSTAPVERLLVGFTFAERQRLRYLRQLYERGKLTEFPHEPRD